MVQMAIHQVIHVIAMRNRFVAAVRTVSVRLLMRRAGVVRRAFLRVRCRHLDLMVVHMIAVSVMQVAIVQIIRVVVVFHGGVPAVWAMLVGMGPGVLLVSLSHCFSPFEPLVVARKMRTDDARFHFAGHRFINFTWTASGQPDRSIRPAPQPASLARACASTSTPRAMSSLEANSSGRWLTPPRQGMNNIAVGAMRDMKSES